MGMLSCLCSHSCYSLTNLSRLQVPHLGLDAAREAAKKKVKDIQFDPKQTDLDQPKEGEHDDKEHSGGNKWAGGVSSSFFFSRLIVLC